MSNPLSPKAIAIPTVAAELCTIIVITVPTTIAPIIAQIAVKYDGKVKVAKLDVDEAPEVAESFNVSSIPTMIIFKNGEAVAQRVGGAGMGVLEAFINDNI